VERRNFLEDAVPLSAHLTELRRRLHACPEIGFELPRTRAVILEELARLRIEAAEVGNGSIVAQIGEKPAQVLLRADMDGLPVKEETELPFASSNGAMHACGHDLHTAILLGAAALLKKQEKRLSRGVRLLFQPAEELLQGAADAVRAGVTEGIGKAYMLHGAVNTGRPAGTVFLPPAGVIAPSADYFQLTVRGKGCHGADPASGIDPLSAACRILLGLQHLPSREFPPGGRAALTVGALQGGEAYNAIPDSARIRGSMRCFDEDFRNRLKARIREISEGISDAFRCGISVEFPAGCPSLQNDAVLRKQAEEGLISSLGSERVVVIDPPAQGGGSEDFAEISRAVPSLMLSLAAGDPGVPLHHPKVVFDEACLPYGAAALATLGAE